MKKAFMLVERLAFPPKPLGRRRSSRAFTLVERLARPPKPLGRRRSSRAFTLVELLVVIAIIGILVVLLFPAIGAGLHRAREVHCQNNLRQLATAAHDFETDREHLPYASTWSYGNNYVQLNTITNGTLYPILRETSIYLCPLFKRMAKTAVRSYSMNYGVESSTNTSVLATHRMASLNAVPAPSALVLFTEENPYVIPGSPSPSALNDGRLLWNGGESIGTFHRKQSANVVFFDGHAVRYVYQADWKNLFDKSRFAQ
jgi:prepilin-type N-terminal cleavage/methylation domain-containing protein/prepilin-type processing-associated H-X9-DG protein